MNHDILRSYFSDGAKNIQVRLIYKKKDRKNKENYWPVSILNRFSSLWKVHKWHCAPYNTNLSNFVSAYRKYFSVNHVLISLTWNLKKNLNNNKIVGNVFMDLWKVFDYIPHDLLIAKMEACGFSENFFVFIPEASKAICKH